MFCAKSKYLVLCWDGDRCTMCDVMRRGMLEVSGCETFRVRVGGFFFFFCLLEGCWNVRDYWNAFKCLAIYLSYEL
jgi:hypothetical protein